MPAHGFAEPATPPPGPIGLEPGTPPVTPTSTPPRFSLESAAPAPSAQFPSAAAAPVDVEVPPMPQVANAMWSDILGAEIVCCGKKLGLRNAKRMMAIMTVAIVLLVALVLVVTGVAVREADEADAGAAVPVLRAAASPSDPCAPNPCMHGGKCGTSATDPSAHVCTCHEGFVGNECEIDFQTCVSSPCGNGATCVDGADEYRCSCAAGFTGDECEVDILDRQLALCAQHGACQNGGQCHAEAVSGSVGCECIGGFSGEHCEQHADADAGGDTMMSFGNGIDIADAYSSDGDLNLKFAPLFERSSDPESTTGGPVTTKSVRAEASEVEFFESAEDFMRGLTTEFDLAYQPGMLAADVWVAGVRQHAYTARPSSIYGKAVRRMVVEEKDYPTTLRLHPGLSAAIADLPSSLDSDADRDAYYDFLVTFGTHYISKEVFGGLIAWQVFVGNATSQAVPALEDATQRVFDRLLSSSISEAMAGAELELVANIPSITRTQFSVLGGTVSEGNFDTWAATVGMGADMAGREDFLPEMISVNLASIAELAPSFSKRRLIAQAIDQWLLTCASSDAASSAICSDQGICGMMTGRCMCDMGFRGPQCEIRDCPTSNPGKACTGHGLCDHTTGSCACFHNQTTGALLWRGDDCARDVDECMEDRDLCSRHARECVNTQGTYYCGACLVGYEEDDNGFCVDVDECEDASTCSDVLSTCHNSDGSYSCIECHEGFGGLNCEDIDECARPNNECTVNNQECMNTHGGFECSDCNEGYTMNEQGYCIAQDECVESEGLCGAHAECTVDPSGNSGPRCTCHSGYHGDGHTCEPNGCVAATLDNAHGLCEGDFGDSCEPQCDGGYIASGEVTCMEDGQWAGASCLFECPHLTLTGDCFRESNQVYNLAPDLVDGKPHYIGEDLPLHIYYDERDRVWLMDDDLDTVAIHAHMRSADTFPSVRRSGSSSNRLACL
jgi:hypothetical protein